MSGWFRRRAIGVARIAAIALLLMFAFQPGADGAPPNSTSSQASAARPPCLSSPHPKSKSGAPTSARPASLDLPWGSTRTRPGRSTDL